MKITEIRIDVTINLGNYENKKVGATAILDEDEDAALALKQLEEYVYGQGNIESSSKKRSSEEARKESGSEKSSEVRSKKSSSKKEIVSPSPVEETKVEAVEEVVKDEPTASPSQEEVVPEKKEEPKKEKSSKEPKAPKVTYEVYDRGNEIHKKLFSAYLDEAFPGWEKDTSKAASTSRMLVGENYLDKEGEVIQEFKDKATKLMSVK